MDMILVKRNFPNSFLPYFQSHMLYVHTGVASMWQFQCVPTTYLFSINEFFTISFFKHILNRFHLFKEMSIKKSTTFHVVCHAPG